jgi:DNA/RNA-binding domain of Phe-tRNA-synthetase-like protein
MIPGRALEAPAGGPMTESSAVPEPILPVLTPDVAGRVRLGLVRAEPVSVGPAGPALGRALDEVAAELAARHAGRQPAEIEELAPARALYRAFGVDPTRTRPSSEALLRRVLQGKPLPRILNAVDVCTLASLRSLLPIGLYDAGTLRGRVVLRLGGPGESYPGIRKDDVHLEGRLALADDAGPFGNPTSDSLRASVTDRTRSLLMVFFAPPAVPATFLEDQARLAAGDLAGHLGAPGAHPATWVRILG